jgi:ribose transport system substrate-binding protein
MWKNVLCAAGAAAVLMAGSGPAPAASKGLVAFSQEGMENEWRVVDTREMEQAFRKAGYDFVWTNANSDPGKQLADVEDLLARRPVLLIVAPIEYEPLAPVPMLADEARVPLIVVDRALPGQPGKGQWIAMLTTNFVDTGEQVARDVVATLTRLHGKPEGVLLHVSGNTGASPVVDEQTGLNNVFKSYPGIKIAGTCDGRYMREPGRKCTEDLLQAFGKGKVDGVIFDSDDMMVGGIQAIKAAGRQELLGKLWGKDGTVSGLQAMLNGEGRFTVQTPPTFGAQSLKVFEAFKAGQPITPKVQYVPKETFQLDTPAGRDRVKQRIDELHKMGVGCC